MSTEGLELFDICSNRHLGNPESKAAFQVVNPRLNLKQAAVLQYVRECGNQSELKRDGKIVKCGRRMTRSGCYAAVMKAL